VGVPPEEVLHPGEPGKERTDSGDGREEAAAETENVPAAVVDTADEAAVVEMVASVAAAAAAVVVADGAAVAYGLGDNSEEADSDVDCSSVVACVVNHVPLVHVVDSFGLVAEEREACKKDGLTDMALSCQHMADERVL
jgi:hypothetical protein